MKSKMLEIDGAYGEGGGQVLRSSLTLACMTGVPFRIRNIRANRSKPGLRPQHVRAVQAAAAVGGAQSTQASPGTTTLTFTPGAIQTGDFHFEIGTAGATALVLQTVFLPLALANRPSSVTVMGGTHVSWSPSYHYLTWQWLPMLQQLGLDADIQLLKAGFYPRGRGGIQAKIKSAGAIRPLQRMHRGELHQIRGVSAIANLPQHVAERQRQRALTQLAGLCPANVEVAHMPSHYKGSMLLLLAEFEYSQCCYFALGKPGKPAERVADEAVAELWRLLASEGAIDPYLADQLLLPLVFATGPSKFSTSEITEHLMTNAEVIRQFVSAEIVITGKIGQPGSVKIVP